MARRNNTRKARAGELLARLERGPSFSKHPLHEFTPQEAERQFKMWSQSWVIDQLKSLVPELKEAG